MLEDTYQQLSSFYMKTRGFMTMQILTVNSQPCRRAESPVCHIFCHTSVIGPVLLPGLNDDEVTIRCLEVVGVTFRLNSDSVFQPVDLCNIFTLKFHWPCVCQLLSFSLELAKFPKLILIKHSFRMLTSDNYLVLTLGFGTPFGGWHRNSIWLPSSTGWE